MKIKFVLGIRRMASLHTNCQGVVKVYWEDIREHIGKIDPIFVTLVDDISPDHTFPAYLVYFPYAALIGDEQGPIMPKQEGGAYRLSDADAPKDVVKHLGYGNDGSPFGMVLDKNIELFIDLKEDGIIIPWVIYSPGAFFSYARNLSQKNDRIYAPNGVLSAISGARSVFMLPNIGSAVNHSRLQRDFNIQSVPAKSMYEHWQIFKEIFNSKETIEEWCSCVLYFSEKWMDKLHADKAWFALKVYLHDLAWEEFQYERNRFYYEIAFSVIQKKKNLKSNPYLIDTARQLFAIALGAAPGYAPVINDQLLPLETMQSAFAHIYSLKKYLPTIMGPSHFNFETDAYPIYYSLQHPSTHSFSPSTRKDSSTLLEMRELARIMQAFVEILAKGSSMCFGTIINTIAHDMEFKYYHNEVDKHLVINPSKEIIKYDNRFSYITNKNNVTTESVATDAQFLRGCIAMKKK